MHEIRLPQARIGHLQTALHAAFEVIDPNSRYEFEGYDAWCALLTEGAASPAKASALADVFRPHEAAIRYNIHEGWGKSPTILDLLMETLEPGRPPYALWDERFNYLPEMAEQR
jgi:hypothetical protein